MARDKEFGKETHKDIDITTKLNIDINTIKLNVFMRVMKTMTLPVV